MTATSYWSGWLWLRLLVITIETICDGDCLIPRLQLWLQRQWLLLPTATCNCVYFWPWQLATVTAYNSNYPWLRLWPFATTVDYNCDCLRPVVTTTSNMTTYDCNYLWLRVGLLAPVSTITYDCDYLWLRLLLTLIVTNCDSNRLWMQLLATVTWLFVTVTILNGITGDCNHLLLMLWLLATATTGDCDYLRLRLLLTMTSYLQLQLLATGNFILWVLISNSSRDFKIYVLVTLLSMIDANLNFWMNENEKKW